MSHIRPRLRSLLASFFVLRVFLPVADCLCEDAAALTPWVACLEETRKAARLAHNGRVDEADAVLEAASKTLPQPYATRTAVMRGAVKAQFGRDSQRELTHSRCKVRAEVMCDLGECSLALHWAQRAVQIGSDYGYADHERVAWLLAASGNYAEAIQEYEEAKRAGQGKAIDMDYRLKGRIPAISPMLHDAANFTTRLDFVRVHFIGWNRNTGYPRGELRYGLLALEQLSLLFPHAKTEQEYRLAYQAIESCLKAMGDNERLVRWEVKMQAEPWATPRDAAVLLAERADRAYHLDNLAEAEILWRQICEKYPNSKQYGTSQFNVGVVLQKQKKYDAAIVEYMKIFPSQVNDRDPGASVMEMFRNYRHSAAVQISRCYEANGDVAKALDWAILVRDKYAFQSGCGTCHAQESMACQTRILRLLQKNGKRDEVLQLAEKLFFAQQSLARMPESVPVILAEEYFMKGRAKELRSRLEKESQEKGADVQAFTDALNVLATLDFAQRHSVAGLWMQTQKAKTSAMGAVMPGADPSPAGVAALKLMKEQDAQGFLQRKLKGTHTERSWAVVLLVTMGKYDDAKAIQEMARAVPENFSTSESSLITNFRQLDFCYALLLLDPNSEKDLYLRFVNSSLVYALQDAAKLMKEAETEQFR